MSEHLETNDIPLSLSCNMSHTILRRWDGEHFIFETKEYKHSLVPAFLLEICKQY